jgi:hypothetical protein
MVIYGHPVYGYRWSAVTRMSDMVLLYPQAWRYGDGDGTCNTTLYIHHIQLTVASPRPPWYIPIAICSPRETSRTFRGLNVSGPATTLSRPEPHLTTWTFQLAELAWSSTRPFHIFLELFSVTTKLSDPHMDSLCIPEPQVFTCHQQTNLTSKKGISVRDLLAGEPFFPPGLLPSSPLLASSPIK